MERDEETKEPIDRLDLRELLRGNQALLADVANRLEALERRITALEAVG